MSFGFKGFLTENERAAMVILYAMVGCALYIWLTLFENHLIWGGKKFLRSISSALNEMFFRGSCMFCPVFKQLFFRKNSLGKNEVAYWYHSCQKNLFCFRTECRRRPET